MPAIIKTMNCDEGDGPDYRIHYECTSPGRPAKINGLPENNYPAEAPAWEITGIDCEEWDIASDSYKWVPLEEASSSLNIEAIKTVERWAESLDLGDEVVEDAIAEREAYQEQQAESRRDRLED